MEDDGLSSIREDIRKELIKHKKDRIEELTGKIKTLTTQADLLLDESEILDGRAERCSDRLTSNRYSQKSLRNRQKVGKILQEVEKLCFQRKCLYEEGVYDD